MKLVKLLKKPQIYFKNLLYLTIIFVELMKIKSCKREGRELEAELRRRLRREGLAGIGVVAGTTIVLALLVASYYLYTRRSR